jgi:HEAT repeat protein
LTILSGCLLLLAGALPLRADDASHLPQLVAAAAKYESGQSSEPLLKLEQLLRDSFGKPALRAELEAGFVKLLAPTSTFEARRFACQWLAAIGTDASLPAIAKLLDREETVGIGCLALSSRRTPQVSAVLRKALAAARGRAQLQLISALGNHQDPQSVQTLAALAADADAAVARTALCSLGKIPTAAARDAVARLAQQPQSVAPCMVTEARLRVAQQLAAAGDRKAAAAIYTELLGAKQPVQVRRGALGALLRLDADGGQQRIVATLAQGDAVLVPVAIARVGALKAPEASALFAAQLARLSPAAQAWMIEALATRGDAPARQAIRGQLSAQDLGVRRAAVAAVGKLDDASAVPLLAKALAAATEPAETQDIEVALGSLRGGVATDRALVAQLPQLSAAAKARVFAVLVRRGARTALPALLAEAGGADAETVLAAFRAVGWLATPADVPAVLDKLVALRAGDARDDAESAAARALAKMANATARSAAVRATLAKSTNLEARCSLLRLLPKAADAQALAALQAAGKDQDARIRDAAVRGLVGWPDASGWAALWAVFQKPESNTHRALVLRAMVRLAGEQNAQADAALIARYRQLLAGARNDDERKLVLGALAGAAHPEALPLALSLAAQPGVRAEAALAVRKIAAAVKAQHPQAAQAALEQLRKAKP